MKPFTCAEVEAQIDLFAADEVAEPACTAIREHLTGCPGCAEAYRAAQHLLGLMDIHYQQPERLQRLQKRLETVAAPPGRNKARMLPFLRLAGSLAALLLVGVGLFLWLGQGLPPGEGDKGETQLAVQDKNDFARWPKTVIRESAEFRVAPPLPATARTNTPGETIVWAAPGAKWHARTGRHIDLTAGKLFVRVSPAVRPREAGFKVQTPVAVAEARVAAFFIEVRKGATSRKVVKHLVYVTIVKGGVQLSNNAGTVTGSTGDKLWATDREAVQVKK